MQAKKLSIIIPAYNESKTLVSLLEKIENVSPGLEKEIIIVDDDSTDGTVDILRGLDQSQYKVILKNKNEGKGAAIKTGLGAAGGDFVIFQDADLEYDPEDYKILLKPLLENTADLVIGSRVLSGSIRLFGPHRVSLVTYFGCRITALAINILYGRRGTDYYGCYKAIRREALKDVLVKANGFEYDAELLCKLFKRGIKAVEVPTSYQSRDYSAGKKLSWRDGLIVMRSIIRWRFQN